ncbi:MAG: 50S ribosomal protein L28 [Candidatus Syntrophonatronum acetioxidans]|uniref:Large ribosomal subunit protein bL28 n=1 Tax=Candidatus Syntrophonatronum acetioxidans TaxID=1795816 RepID=A0A424YHX1_9FIRM|nr:MAG: 50S ribosomal protein L28 [Candidatus Syntrophonatronum acetioxidans]
MARKCIVCGKGAHTGHKVSHSNIKTKRTWIPNVQKVKIMVKGTPKKAYVCTRCLKGHKVQRAI